MSGSPGVWLEQLLLDYLAWTHKVVSGGLDCKLWNKYIIFHLL